VHALETPLQRCFNTLETSLEQGLDEKLRNSASPGGA